ncbi:carbohydrate ABC transporter permease [Pseudokineococcus basanitobsidens]|uniref:Carbohydrate ABC transporter permease n=1 Tax=Pseudokineococcus basanitobsidens TaxID=1926649 RepID=A0ABU8RF69_9ACTN
MTTTTSTPTPGGPVGARRADAPAARRRRVRPDRVLLWTALLVLSLVFALPLLVMVSTSFKSAAEANSLDFTALPLEPTLDAYRAVLTDVPVLRWFVNSTLVALMHSALVVVLATTAAYAFARMEFRGKRPLFALVLATMFVPAVILLIPNFLVVNELGWLNSYASLVVPGAAGGFGVFFLRQFFLGIHPSIEEQARIDGCGSWQVFVRIVLPLAGPAVATLAVLSFLTSWNDFLWPVFVLFTSDMQTLPAGLAQLQSDNVLRYDLLMAGAVVASVPVLALYVVAQRFIIEGVAQGGVKG